MTVNIHEQRILILDFGSQYTQLIARRIREIGVYCEIYPFDIKVETLKDFAPKGIILSGGPETVLGCDTPRAPKLVFEMGCPVLGICYGMQTMAAQLGGEVEAAAHREYGYAQVQVQGPNPLLDHIEDKIDKKGFPLLDVWMSHGDRVISLPIGFHCIASTLNAPLAGMGDEKRHFYGLQFHPEVTHTPQGERILSRFVLDICRCQPLWNPVSIITDTIKRIRQQVDNDEVILGLSGGVDSSVVAALLHKAIKNQLICIFVDTGLLRHKEAEEVLLTFEQHLGVRVLHVDAKSRFLKALENVSDPEAKRKIIGNEFIKVFEEEASKFPSAKWLSQGTIYPDVIESAGTAGKSHMIKSHHNVGGLPEQMNLKLLEPLRELFKDEVRKLGLELGLPHEMIYRHPFPGPGLGVRILGEVRSEFIKILQASDAIYIEELRQHGYYHKVSQAFCVFLPVKSVGVMGDARKYDYVIALRAVETIDFMTAHWAHLPYDLLSKISQRIINEVPGISRVVYDISGKPPATIEWE